MSNRVLSPKGRENLKKRLAFENYAPQLLKIRNKKRQIIPFQFNKAQLVINQIRQWLIENDLLERFIFLKARQKGISTYWEADIFHAASTSKQQKCAVIAHKLEATQNLYDMTQRYYQYLDPAYKPITKNTNEKKLKYRDLESEIKVMTAGMDGEDTGRSDTLSRLHCSEVAFWNNAKETLLSLLQTVPDEAGTLVVLESTANGLGGEYHERWQEVYTNPRRITIIPGVAWYSPDSGYVGVFISWLIDDEYTRPFKTDQDKQYLLDTLTEKEKNLTKLGASYEHLNFRRFSIKNKAGGDEAKWRQEYPSCITAETRIGTNKGLILVRDVIAESVEYGTLGKLIKSHKQTPSQIYKLTTKDGYSLRGTFDHPIFLESGLLAPLSALSKGQKIKLQPPRFADNYYQLNWTEIGVNHNVVIDENWGKLLGYFMGDGSLNNNTLSIVCDKKDQDIIQDAQNIIFNVLCLGSSTRLVGSKMGGVEIRTSNVKIKPLFDKLGLLRRNGPAKDGIIKRNVHVPDCIWKSPKPVIREFLRALFECDGFNDYRSPRIVLFSKYLQFIKDIQLLLLGFGVVSSVRTHTRKNGTGYIYESNELVLHGIRVTAFYKQIGFIGQRKINRNCEILNKNRANVISNDLLNDVESIIENGFEETYDFTVEGGEAFDANGILTHNTPEEAFLASGRPVVNSDIANDNLNACPREPYKRGELIPVYDFTSAEYRRLIAAGVTDYASLKKYIKEIKFIENEQGLVKIHYALKLRDDERYRFAAGSDIAEGLEQGDRTICKVLDRKNMQVILTWAGHLATNLYAEEIHKMQLFFNNDIYFAIERNNQGLGVITKAAELGVKLYYEEDFNKGVVEGTDRLGFRTSDNKARSGTRTLMINDLVAAITDNEYEDKEREFWGEILTFVYDAQGRQAAQDKLKDPNSRCYDDRIFAAIGMWKCHLWMPNFKKVKVEDTNVEALLKRIKEKNRKLTAGTTAMSR